MAKPVVKPAAKGLALLEPLLGLWNSQPGGDEPQSRMPCSRIFTRMWHGAYIRLDVRWHIAENKAYDEMAMFGIGRDGSLGFWSFTSDGKQTHGWLTDATDVHENAIGFVTEVPAGTARMVYWPHEGGIDYAVESRTQDGWNRFLRHHYVPVLDPTKLDVAVPTSSD